MNLSKKKGRNHPTAGTFSEKNGSNLPKKGRNLSKIKGRNLPKKNGRNFLRKKGRNLLKKKVLTAKA